MHEYFLTFSLGGIAITIAIVWGVLLSDLITGRDRSRFTIGMAFVLPCMLYVFGVGTFRTHLLAEGVAREDVLARTFTDDLIPLLSFVAVAGIGFTLQYYGTLRSRRHA